ncbi:DgyrCDS7703 [Dimorphilus gyrociliatus]|uniref:DgyrCDS7703 n=1 Tax=Dimorphilus gyrociliatus TaxID=2664684 RepID=A0A7I8VSW4_9ANNE|nr:DgyrCDS7703 [Dimorphilus gyrociliatus]
MSEQKSLFDELPPPPSYSEIHGAPSTADAQNPTEPSAPPVHLMENYEGYGELRNEPVEPPPYTPPAGPHIPPIPVDQQRPATEEEAREALLELISTKCCWSVRPARELVITDLVGKSITHYSLQSWTEIRATSWDSEPYTGDHVDWCPPNQAPPNPWEVPVHVPSAFSQLERSVRVPRTESVKLCFKCNGIGRQPCWNCRGSSHIRCNFCHGRGRERRDRMNSSHNNFTSCRFCNGSGSQACFTCNGSGNILCKTCRGFGKIKCFIKLTITWKTHLDNHIDLPLVPENLIKQAAGVVVVQDERDRVTPIDYSRGGVTEASRKFVNQHATSWPLELIRRQKQVVRVIRVTECKYVWDGNQGTFYVIGDEMKAYCSDYPKKCFCSCSIL